MMEEPFLIAFRVHPSASSGPIIFYDEIKSMNFLASDYRRPLANTGYLLATETKTAQRRETDDTD